MGVSDKLTWLGSEVGLPMPAWLGDLLQRCGHAGDVIAFPGLVNSHDHLDFNCYPPTGAPPYGDVIAWSRDVQAKRTLIETIEAIPAPIRTQFGLLKNLLWGVTAVADHGGRPSSGPITVLTCHACLHSPEAERWGRLKLLAGSNTVVAHIAEGTTPESRARARRFLRWNLRHRPIAGVHAVSFEAEDFARLEALIWCPASNLFLFGRTADVAAAAQRTRILFGTDSTLSAPGTLWDHLRQVRGMLPDHDLLASLTVKAGDFWNLPPSHWQNNFVVARRRRADRWDSFFALTPADILLVVSGGEIALADSALAEGLALSGSFSTVADTQKFVRLPVPDMVRQIREASLDQAALFDRLTGHSARAAGRAA